MVLQKYYRTSALEPSAIERIRKAAEERLTTKLDRIETEYCFYVDVDGELSFEEEKILRWLLSETFQPKQFGTESFMSAHGTVLEVGPRLTFETPFSSNAVAIFHKCGLTSVRRIERSVRYGISPELLENEYQIFLAPLHDRMTEEHYLTPRESFDSHNSVEPVRIIPIFEEGITALQRANIELGLAMDDEDQNLWFDLFKNKLERNSTDSELFQIGQANSEHCRHGWFMGKHIIDGEEFPLSPMQIVKSLWKARPDGSVIAFADNSSALYGSFCRLLFVNKNGTYGITKKVLLHPTLTAETHNHPSGVEPFQGAATGGGGRIRDNQMVGRGGFVMVGGAGYCTGNLHIPGYSIPGEEDGWQHPNNPASPLEIILRASDGASYYGNCFGEPIIYGFARTFGLQLPDEYRSWFKPIMYSVGAGAVREEHAKKIAPENGMQIVLLGGPGYRIGVGGGSASSMIAGSNAAELDFASVQRGNPEMENLVNRVIRACINMGEDNPILSAHDLGAGGTCNALPEIANPMGAIIFLRNIPVADPSLSVREIWGNESQERNVILVKPERIAEIQMICEREGCPIALVGEISDNGTLILFDPETKEYPFPVDLPMEQILGKLPQKTFVHTRTKTNLKPLVLPDSLSVGEALNRVLRLPAVASKRWLTNKVDRSVTGLVAQQQCVGPNHTPVSDCAIRADSHFGLTGSVMGLGEQPIKGLINPKAMGRLAVAEAYLNMVGAHIDDRREIKCSANWMWAAKLKGEGPKLIDAATTAVGLMKELEGVIDGGKDSLAMAAKAFNPQGLEETVKSPGQLVIALYARTSDITKKVTPDLKEPGNYLIWIDCGSGKARLGGSALAQAHSQIGDNCPDIENPSLLVHTFDTVQRLIQSGDAHSVHDVSDGGLIVTLLEMAFAGNAGLEADLKGANSTLATLFAEEPGLVLEISPNCLNYVLKEFPADKAQLIGLVGDHQNNSVQIRHNGESVLWDSMTNLRNIWEETSNQLEMLQANPECIAQQSKALEITTPPPYHLTFKLQDPKKLKGAAPKVAVVREEGSNGDQEMVAALMNAGFKVSDVPMNKLIHGVRNLDEFRGVVFVGGFAFADALGAGKGWAGVIRFNPKLKEQFERFYNRPDTFSLGVCNGFQMETCLGWLPGGDIAEVDQPRLIRNQSGRFESRFTTVKIMKDTNSIMLKGMGGSILGVWVAHGEGRVRLSDDYTLPAHQAPIRYVDHEGNPTTQYPFNPNGSPQGIAALCSADGRHLGMMPHPERSVLAWQLPWIPMTLRKLKYGPWQTMFNNAYEWCIETRYFG